MKKVIFGVCIVLGELNIVSKDPEGLFFSKDSPFHEQVPILIDEVPKTFSFSRITHKNRHCLMY